MYAFLFTYQGIDQAGINNMLDVVSDCANRLWDVYAATDYCIPEPLNLKLKKITKKIEALQRQANDKLAENSHTASYYLQDTTTQISRPG